MGEVAMMKCVFKTVNDIFCH